MPIAHHWPEYLMEAAGLGLFMIAATVGATLLEHPAFGLREAIPDPALRRALMGLAMGLTAIGIIYSPMGTRSGAHLNPAVTLTFWRLGKIAGADAAAYALFQLAGGLLGTLAGALVVWPWAGRESVDLVTTRPGPGGAGPAFVAEAAISFVLMLVVLSLSSTPRLERFTGLAAGALVAAFILIEAPLSGMSMNPARTLASAIPAASFDGLWIYALAPPIGMLSAAETFLRFRRGAMPFCAKLQHAPPCIFCDAVR
jgi:aquaporin Z